jgi:hypothetical protein
LEVVFYERKKSDCHKWDKCSKNIFIIFFSKENWGMWMWKVYKEEVKAMMRIIEKDNPFFMENAYTITMTFA